MEPDDTFAWTLPRPRMKPYYKGGFPLHFESRLLELLGFDAQEHYTGMGRQLSLLDGGDKILHPFGGRAEYGLRLDLREQVKPHLIADAHRLPFKDHSFSCVIVDPPYTDELSRVMYNTGKLKYYTYVSEAVRVCKPGGYVVLYHVVMLPRPKGTEYFKRIYLGIRQWHRLRYVGIFRKMDADEIAERGI